MAVLAIALGMARNMGALAAPAHLLVFALAVAVYIFPVVLAMYRDCEAVVWISVVDVLLGWTILGWFVALGWAASGKRKGLPPAMPHPPIHPVAGH